MMYFVYGLFVLILVGFWIAIYQIKKGVPTEEELYGMSEEAYKLRLFGEEEFRKSHTEEELEIYKKELESLGLDLDNEINSGKKLFEGRKRNLRK